MTGRIDMATAGKDAGGAPEPTTSPSDNGAREIVTFCRVCHACCGIVATVEGDRIVKVRGDSEHALSRGYTCPKGRAVPFFHHRPDRLDDPLMRADGVLEVASWPDCLDDVAARLSAIRSAHGTDAIGMYQGSGAAFDDLGSRIGARLMRRLGSASFYTSLTVDTPNKHLVPELMAGIHTLNPIIDWQRCSLTILVGVNPVVSHGQTSAFPDPVSRLRSLAAQGELWVIDPRRTESAGLATRHMAARPGTDWMVFAWLVREILADGADRAYLDAHTVGVADLAEAVGCFDLETTAARTGVDTSMLEDLLASVRRHGRFAIQTGTGVSMAASANVCEWLVWALQVITQSFDRPGGSWFNPGYFSRLHERTPPTSDGAGDPGPKSRPELAARWGQFPVSAMIDEIESGNLHALLVVGGNPIIAAPETGRFVKALERLEVLVVSDVVHTSTTQLASHVFPATDFAERPNMPIGIDQFLPAVVAQYGRAIVTPKHRRKPTWWPFAQIAQRMGVEALPHGFDADSATDDALLANLATRGPIDFDELRAERTAVVTDEAVFGWVERSVLPDGRWDLAPRPLVEQLGLREDPAPFALIPRRQQRHFNSQLASSMGDDRPTDVPLLLISPDDARSRGFVDGAQVVVHSASGSVECRLSIDRGILPGTVSLPHGFDDNNVSYLTSSSVNVDPLTGMVLQSGLDVTIVPAGT